MIKNKVIGYYGYWVYLTYLSVVSAITGIYFAISGNVFLSIVCLMISGVCDMFDGTVAKTKKRNDEEKKYGIQIDALADIVSFGVLPIAIGYAIYSDILFENKDIFPTIINIIIFSSYVLAALIRLAYFNVQEMKLQDNNISRQYYEGLPVTSVALIIPLVYCLCMIFDIPLDIIFNKLYLIILLLFISKVRIPKIKGKKLFILLFIGLILFILMLLMKFIL